MAVFKVDAPQGVNDRALIQEQIDKALKAGGGVVVLPEGTFNVGSVTGKDGKSEALMIPSNVILKGAGAGKTVINYTGSEEITGVIRTPSKGNYIDASGATRKLEYGTHDVTIEGLTVNGNGKAKSGIYVGQTPGKGEDKATPEAVASLIAAGKADTNITIQNVEAKGAWHAGLNIHELTSGLKMRDVVSHDNKGEDGDGIILDGVHGAELANVQVYNNDRHGLNVVSGSRSINVQGLVTTGNGQNGLVVQTPEGFPTKTGDVTVNGVDASGNGKKPVHTKDAEQVTVNGNRVAELSVDMQRALAQAADPNYASTSPNADGAQAGLPVLAAARDVGGRSA